MSRDKKHMYILPHYDVNAVDMLFNLDTDIDKDIHWPQPADPLS